MHSVSQKLHVYLAGSDILKERWAFVGLTCLNVAYLEARRKILRIEHVLNHAAKANQTFVFQLMQWRVIQRVNLRINRVIQSSQTKHVFDSASSKTLTSSKAFGTCSRVWKNCLATSRQSSPFSSEEKC